MSDSVDMGERTDIAVVEARVGEEFKDYLRRQLRVSGVGTQQALSRAIGMDYGQLNKIFTGRTQRPEIETLEKIARAIDRPIDEVLSAAGYPLDRGRMAVALATEPTQYRLFDDDDTFTEQEMVDYVVSRPGRHYQERIAVQRRRLDPIRFRRWCVGVFNAFRSNSNLALQSLELGEDGR